MSGESYQVFMAPSAHRKYKKFSSDLLKQEIGKLSEEPHRYEELKGPLKGIRSYHFEHGKTQYRIAYRVLEKIKEIEVVLIKPRETFYQALRRIV